MEVFEVEDAVIHRRGYEHWWGMGREFNIPLIKKTFIAQGGHFQKMF